MEDVFGFFRFFEETAGEPSGNETGYAWLGIHEEGSDPSRDGRRDHRAQAHPPQGLRRGLPDAPERALLEEGRHLRGVARRRRAHSPEGLRRGPPDGGLGVLEEGSDPEFRKPLGSLPLS